MKIFREIIFFILLIGMTACDHHHEQHFYIQNDLDSTILMHFDIGDKTDSTTNILAKSKTEIWEYGGPYGSVGVVDDRDNDGLKNLKFETNDTIVSLDETLWNFEKATKYHGNSTIIIDSTLLH